MNQQPKNSINLDQLEEISDDESIQIVIQPRQKPMEDYINRRVNTTHFQNRATNFNQKLASQGFLSVSAKNDIIPQSLKLNPNSKFKDPKHYQHLREQRRQEVRQQLLKQKETSKIQQKLEEVRQLQRKRILEKKTKENQEIRLEKQKRIKVQQSIQRQRIMEWENLNRIRQKKQRKIDQMKKKREDKQSEKKKMMQQQIQKKNKEEDLFFQSIIGIKQQPKQQQQELIKSQSLKELNEQIEEQKFNPRKIKRRQMPRNEDISALIKIILEHSYRETLISQQVKRIPTSFKDRHTYTKKFHYLLANQCITDLQQRLKKLQHSNNEVVKAQIQQIIKNKQDMIEITLKQNKKNNDTFLLKNFSLSHNRLGLITNKLPFKVDNYGFSSQNKDQFSFICMLITPQTKQQINSDNVKVLCCINNNELQFILEKKSSKQIFFIDIEKISTSIRQYLAISNLFCSQLEPFIINPELIEKYQPNLIKNRECLDRILQVIQSQYNEIQLQSIRQMVYRSNGIILLQGPPGTGKTSTLLGLLAVQYQYLKNTKSKQKIMICAPSNAAIDHITKRIIAEGLYSSQFGQRVKPKVLRVGIVQTKDEDILSVSLDQICEKLMSKKQNANNKFNMTNIQIKQKIMQIQKQLHNLIIENKKKSSKASQNQIAQCYKDIMSYQSLLYEFRKEKISKKNLYAELQRFQLQSAQIYLTTLSSSYTEKLQKLRHHIGCLIVDEAAQATQPNLLIALQTGVEKVLLVGDPFQLPATTLSNDSLVTGFNRSLFERLLDAGLKPYFLSIQYRMVPKIRQFPSFQFYNDRLRDGQSVLQRPLPQKLQQFDQRNVIFVDVNWGNQNFIHNSYDNLSEAFVIRQIIVKLGYQSSAMGIITPYTAQRKLIINQLNHKIPKQQTSKIMINTIDSFQGQQKDIIFISCVRANNRRSIGFLLDERRINVALTRGKFLLVVVGNANTLGSNEVWNRFIEFCEDKSLYYKIGCKVQIEKIVQKIFHQYSSGPYDRIKHTKLTQDPRKDPRNFIQSNDHQKKKRNHEKQRKNIIVNNNIQKIPETPIKKPEKIMQFKGQAKTEIKQQNFFNLQQKKQRLNEGIELQKKYESVLQMQKKIRKGQVQDEFLKMLLQ